MEISNIQANQKRFYESQKERGLVKTFVWIPDDKEHRDKIANYAKRLRKSAGKQLPRD